MTMKRYNDGRIIIGVLMIVVGYGSMIINININQSHQEVMATLTGISEKLDWCGQCSEVMTASVVEEPVINDCPVYCNSVSCRCDKEAYKERDKISNDDPSKFEYIEDRGRENYFNPAMYH